MSKEEEIEDGEDFSLTAKMKMVMGVCQTVQNSLDLVASYCERVKKYVLYWFCQVKRSPDHEDLRILEYFPFTTIIIHCQILTTVLLNLTIFLLCSVFNWTIPFLSFMAASVLISGTIILYFLPLRWLVLAWGKYFFALLI